MKYFLFFFILFASTSCKKSELKKAKLLVKQLPTFQEYKVNKTVKILNELLEIDRKVLLKIIKPKGNNRSPNYEANNIILAFLLFEPFSEPWPVLYKYYTFPEFKNRTILNTFPVIIVDNVPIILVYNSYYEGFPFYMPDYFDFIKNVCLVRRKKFNIANDRNIEEIISKVGVIIKGHTEHWNHEERIKFNEFLKIQLIVTSDQNNSR